MKTSERIIQYIKDQGEVSVRQLTEYLGISERAVFKQLSKLVRLNKLTKVGMPPKVFYKIKVLEDTKENIFEVEKKIEKSVEANFLYITPLGESFIGIKGFIKWCTERNLDPKKQIYKYYGILEDINKERKNGLINATAKFNTSFKNNFLKEVFYIDFYSIPQFGKTKLGQLLLYAKQSQDKKRIKSISEIAQKNINKVIKLYKIEAVGFIPPTVKREVQFMKELERNLNLKLPVIKISKIKTDVIVPQKTLSKMRDRIINASNTFILEDKRIFKNVLLIDDAVGSGATLNETAKKIINNNVSENVFGLAVTGSYKGFDVISEV
ncbi:DeoR family transcriptional regulator [Candidatus Dojkabacteria bacterium]|nr:DeoR family transcriptional regulator [Candidatus Dojkabacteria bacterium]